jgi:magnesium-transporting ATPase (P-type)
VSKTQCVVKFKYLKKENFNFILMIENNTVENKDEIKYWKLTHKELLQHFKTNDTGYTNKDIEDLKSKYPPNELAEEEKETIFEKIYEQFQDTLVRILLAAAVISFVIALTGDGLEGLAAYIEPFVILLILIANAAIGVYQDLNADNAIEKLKSLQPSRCTVLRNGQTSIIDSKDLIPGDMVILREGDKVPADIRLVDIETSNFEVSEAAFTGEPSTYKISEPIDSNEKPGLSSMKNVVFSASGVIIGHARGIVVKTGMETEIGSIQKDVMESKEHEEKSPLQQKLEEFGDNLTYIIGAICIIVWVINYKNFFDESHGSFFSGMIYYFKISVALAVAAIPEGLPAVITTCLALGSSRMSANHAIVRKLDAIETLGCTSVICSDKTGTLTTNNMSVTKVLLIDSENDKGTVKEITGTSFNPEGEVKDLTKGDFEHQNLQLTTAVASICNMSKIRYNDNNNNFEVIGSPTEGALKVFAEKLRIYDSRYQNKVSPTESPMAYNEFILKGYKVLYTLEFDRNRKAMSVLALDLKTNKPVLLTKGAPEILFNQTKSYLTSNGEVCNFTDNYRGALLNKINEEFTSKTLRSLALYVKEDLPSLKGIDYNDRNSLKLFFKEKERVLEIEKDLTLVGVVGMLDPPRPQVKSAISTCQDAGIRVIMITGDNKNTAEAIAQDIGMLETGDDVKACSYTTEAFFKLSVDKQKEVLQKSTNMIFSRSEPKHKMQLVQLLKGLKYIVAMTGDGVNDAPALAESHIGVAMGLTGTEVAKEAADIVLADDNFATIVKAIEEGRSIYMNMKAFIRYLISSNIGEVVSIFITSFFGMPEAFTSIQLLWVRLNITIG